MSLDDKFALLIPNIGIGDQICLIPSFKKLRERFGKFDILYYERNAGRPINPGKLSFYNESEYIKRYRHVSDNLRVQIPKNDIILYDEIKALSHPAIGDMLNKPIHSSILYLKELNLEYNDETPEKEIEINLPEDRVDEYAHFNDYYVIAPCHQPRGQFVPWLNGHYFGRWFDLNVYSKLVKRFNKNIKFVSLYDSPLPYETETFWPDNLNQLQFFLKSVKGVVTIDSSIQHYCNALRKKALVLWGYGKSRVRKYGYKSHINIFNKINDFYDDLPHCNNHNFVSKRTEKDIDYEIFFKSFEELIEKT